MPGSNDTSERERPADPLASVAEAAGARLRAQIDDDGDTARAASEALMSATMSAMSTGHSLRDITAAEARGESDVRSQLRGDVLKRVDRAARHIREAEATYHTAIGRAVRLGLSTREVAQAAGVTHGTIRALAQRLAPAASEPERAGVAPVSMPREDTAATEDA